MKGEGIYEERRRTVKIRGLGMNWSTLGKCRSTPRRRKRILERGGWQRRRAQDRRGCEIWGLGVRSCCKFWGKQGSKEGWPADAQLLGSRRTCRQQPCHHPQDCIFIARLFENFCPFRDSICCLCRATAWQLIPHILRGYIWYNKTIWENKNNLKHLFLLSFYRTQVSLVRSMDPVVSHKLSHLFKLNWCDSSWWRYKLNTNW